MRFFRKESTDVKSSIKGETEEDSNSKLTTITNYLNNAYITKIESRTQSIVESAQNYQIGLVLMFTGLVFLFVSFMFLPLVIISPYKFCALNAFGTFTLFASLIFIRGNQVLASLFGKEKILYTISFFGSLLAEIYFSVIHKSYLMVILFLIVHLASIAYLVLSILPGGVSFLNGTFKYIFKFITMLFKRVLKREDNLLPI
jgi:hypothetical protein